MTERLLDDDASPALVACGLGAGHQMRLAEHAGNLPVVAGWCRQIEDVIAARAALLVQHCQQLPQRLVAAKVAKLGLVIEQAFGERLPDRRIDRTATGELIDRIKCLLAKIIMRKRPASHADN